MERVLQKKKKEKNGNGVGKKLRERKNLVEKKKIIQTVSFFLSLEKDLEEIRFSALDSIQFSIVDNFLMPLCADRE